MKARELIIEPCGLSAIKGFVEENHYSHNLNGVKVAHCFKVTHNNRLVGGVVFGAMSTTAWKKFGQAETDVLELRRLVLLDEAERNSETRTIGYCLRWIKQNSQGTKVIVSYADPKYGHSGVIYRAANFEYLGLSGGDTGYYDPETGKTYHSRSLRVKYKGRYKPFVIKLRDKLERGLLIPVDLPPKHCFIYRLK